MEKREVAAQGTSLAGDTAELSDGYIRLRNQKDKPDYESLRPNSNNSQDLISNTFATILNTLVPSAMAAEPQSSRGGWQRIMEGSFAVDDIFNIKKVINYATPSELHALVEATEGHPVHKTDVGIYIYAYEKELAKVGGMALNDTLYGTALVVRDEFAIKGFSVISRAVGISERTVRLIDYALTWQEVSHSNKQTPTIYDNLLQKYK